MSATTVARLSCEEMTAKRLAAIVAETFEADDVACAAFEHDGGGWEVAIHFRNPPDERALRDLVTSAAGDAAASALRFEALADTDWVQASLAGLKPVPAGRFVVHGAHDRARVAPNRIGIEIEAALAFGTGHHGTTRGCLLALDDLAKRRRARRVLDIGTGSGVLAIAAARRLHAKVIAGDIDAQSVLVARDNARINHAAPRINFVRAAGLRHPAIAARQPYDLIFANILLGPLTRLATALKKASARNAWIILSGLLPAHANAALAIYRSQGFTLERRIPLDGWTTLVLRRGKNETAPGGETGAVTTHGTPIRRRGKAGPSGRHCRACR